jgi:hypothetical protein
MLMLSIESAGESGPSSSTVIEILSERENSSDIKVINGPGPVLRDRINKYNPDVIVRLRAIEMNSRSVDSRDTSIVWIGRRFSVKKMQSC